MASQDKHRETHNSGPCRICRAIYVESVPSDHAAHRQDHKRLAAGELPRVVREFMKSFGWAVAHNDGGLDRLKSDIDPEIGKLSVAYSWWNRARANDCPKSDFDAYMKAHLAFIDALVENDPANIRQAELGIKRWEKYAG